MSELRHDDVHFEPTDIKVGPVVWFLAILFVATGGIMVFLWWVQGREIARETRLSRPGNAPILTAHEQLPPEPRIEGVGLDKASHSPSRTDLPTSAAVWRADEEAKLRSGWTDSGGGKHPPIDDAMRQIVEKFRGAK